MQGADVDRAFGVGVWRFVEFVQGARLHALVVDAGESVLAQEPFEDVFALVYPCYSGGRGMQGGSGQEVCP